MANSRDLSNSTEHVMNANDKNSFPVTEDERRDINQNMNNQMKEPGNILTADDERESFPTHSPVMTTSDPLLRQVYTTPAAGGNFPQDFDPNSSRNYKMASDIFGTGMDRSWSGSPASVPGSPKITSSQKSDVGNEGPRSVPRSFKITEMPASPSGSYDDQSNTSAAGRRARESNGNPLTGQGITPESGKTGKRYFEGSNANQKLW